MRIFIKKLTHISIRLQNVNILDIIILGQLKNNEYKF